MTAIIDPPHTDFAATAPDLVAAGAKGNPGQPVRRRRGRPLQMTPEGVLDEIRQLAGREDGLFRVHMSHSGLYARARRQFGSWSEAVRQAGVNYDDVVDTARARSLYNRKRRRRRFSPQRATRTHGEHSQPDAQEEDFGRA